MEITVKRSVTINVGNFQVVTVGCEIKDQLYKGEDEHQASERIKNYVVKVVNKDIQDINKTYKVKHPVDTTSDDIKIDIKPLEVAASETVNEIEESKSNDESEKIENVADSGVVEDKGIDKVSDVKINSSVKPDLVINDRRILLKNIQNCINKLQDIRQYNEEHRMSVKKLCQVYEVHKRSDFNSLSTEILADLSEKINQILLSNL
jgi:hypothetical protein